MTHEAWAFSGTERAEVLSYLRTLYTGVFSEAAFEGHLDNHVGFAFADYTVAVMAPHVPKGARILDIGSGFGSCVLAGRDAGWDAIGIEVSQFEVEFAWRRLASLRPQDNPHEVYKCGDALSVDLPAGQFDAVTLWNVLEHINDLHGLMQRARLLLKPGGILYAICPNYFAWRQEAHYHVPWKPNPLLPPEKVRTYLRSLGKDPSFFDTSIFRRTNHEVLLTLRSLDFDLRDMTTLQPMGFKLKSLSSMLLHPLRFIGYHNPFRHSVVLAAVKC